MSLCWRPCALRHRFAVNHHACKSGQRSARALPKHLEPQEKVVVPHDVDQRVDGAVEAREAAAHLVRNVNVFKAFVADAGQFQDPGL